MSIYCMIEIAFDKKSEVDKVTEELLNRKIAVSCQVVESKSYWNWKSQRESSKEYLMFVKTKKEFEKEIYEVVKKIHSYSCFEFATFNLESCNDDYLKWIDNETKK